MKDISSLLTARDDSQNDVRDGRASPAAIVLIAVVLVAFWAMVLTFVMTH